MQCFWLVKPLGLIYVVLYQFIYLIIACNVNVYINSSHNNANFANFDVPPYIVSSFVCDALKSCMLCRFQNKCCMIIHVLYIKIFTCHITFIVLHQDFHFCCIVFSHLYSVNTTLCYINTTNLCCIKICQRLNWYCLCKSHQIVFSGVVRKFFIPQLLTIGKKFYPPPLL